MAETIIVKDQAGVPKAGTTGQVLVKNSGTDFDYDWADVPTTVTSGSFAFSGTGGSNSGTINYQKSGKLYFNIRATSVSGGINNLPIGIGSDTINKIASSLGITVSSTYQTNGFTANNTPLVLDYNAGTNVWSGTSATAPTWTITTAILAF